MRNDTLPALAVPVSAAGSAPAAERPLAAVLHLLMPRSLALRNRLRRLSPGARIRLIGFAVFGVAVGVGIFTFFFRVLNYFLAVPEFGPVLTYRLLGIVFVTFFSILLFSNVVTSLSTFFLARDLDNIVAAPVSARSFFYARFAATIIDSSWMVLLFAAPAFLAYGIAHQTGPLFYLATLLTLPPFLIIPAALGLITTTMLVNVFPAHRTRDILILLAVFAVAVLYLLFRLVQPERLVNPEGFGDFAEFLNAMRTPEWRFFPSTWAAEVLFPLLGLRDGAPLFHYLLLVTTALVALIAAEIVVERLHLRGWSKAQEGRRARLTRRPLFERLLTAFGAPLPLQTRLLIAKELKTFFRDTSQWSQLILLCALVIVYVYNFSVLPLQGSPLVTFYFKNVIAFLNLALAAFVTAAVAVRFVFPSFSVEGRAVWILRAAPLTARRLWWVKFWVGVVPLVLLAEILVVATNSYLAVMPFMTWIATTTLFFTVIVLVALGLAVGTAYPNFDADNAASIAAGTGGFVYMVLCVGFIGTVVMLEAWPVYVLFMSQLRGTPLSTAVRLGMWSSFGVVAALHIAVFVGSMRYGIRRLETFEV